MEINLKNISDFKNLINKTDDQFEILNELCDFLKEHTKATGVYIGKIEKRKKKITDDDNDLAHIDESLPTIIHYVATCKDHTFMYGKKVNVDEGITYSVYKNEEAQQENSPETENKEEDEENQAKKQNQGELFITEVVREPKIKYFKVPRLGCYFVVAMEYESHLYESVFDKAFENYLLVKQKKEEQERAKEEKEADIERERAEKEAAGESYEVPTIEWEKIEEPPLESIPERYVVCLDTLGQDRIFNEEEKNFVREIIKIFSTSWEAKENNQMNLDKSKAAEHYSENLDFKENKQTEFNDQLLSSAKTEMGNSEFNITEENTEFYDLYFQSKCLGSLICSTPFKEQFLSLNEQKVIKYPKIIQALLYLLGKKREEICEPETNKIKWKVAKTFLNETLIEELLKYTPLGAKPGIPPRYRLINNLEKMIEDYNNIEEIEKYSIVLSLILKWLKDTFNVRKQNILMRKQQRETLKAERKQAIETEEERKKKRDEELAAAIEEAKANWKPEAEEKEDGEEEEKEEDDLFTFMEDVPEVKKEELKEEKKEEFTFDNDEFIRNYDEQNPEIEIPEEVKDELDDDYELPSN